MAQGDITLYNAFLYRHGRGEIDLDTDPIYLALLSTSYTPNIDTHATFASLTNEIVASGYTAGGKTIGTVTITEDSTNDLAKVDAPDVVWSSLATATIGYAVLYKQSATQYLIGYMEIATNSNGNDYSIIWHADGIMVIQQGA
jgi:hypothetical protein